VSTVAAYEDGEVRVEREGGCAWVTLDRPPLNLFAPALIDRLRAAFQALAADPDVRVAVVTGAGRAMTAGMQLQVLRELDRASAKALITRLHQAINAVHDAPFPTIAMVNGACLGAGFELAMACDLCVASSEARLGLPEIRVGVPSVIEAALLPGLVGPARAAELLFTGEAITAERARSWGLVNRVVPPGELRAATAALAAEIAGYAPTALRLQKRLVIQWRTSDLRSAVAAGIEAFADTYATGEPREAASAYLEKRAPRFR
jgi:enoyl-CoA hydratase/carnithine racemase